MASIVKHLDFMVQGMKHLATVCFITVALVTISFDFATVKFHLYCCCSLKYFKFTVGFTFSCLYHFLNMMFVAIKQIDFMNMCSITKSIDLVAQILLCLLKVSQVA